MSDLLSPAPKPTRRLVPLFPLEGVLFPRMPLPMQVRDDRLRALVERCVRRRQTYGVLLVLDGLDASPTADTHDVGTLARIRAIQDYDGVCMNLLSLGTDRFRLLDRSVHRDGYLVGHVETMTDEKPEHPRAIAKLKREMSSLFHDYFHTLVDTAGVDLPEYDLPREAVSLSFVIAAVLQMPVTDRQALLETRITEERFLMERAVLEQQIRMLHDMPRKQAQRATRLNVRPLIDELSRN